MVHQFTFNHYEVNCYIIYHADGGPCAIVDPGASASYEDAQITQFVDEHHLTPTLILITHAHVDHIAGLKPLCERYNLPATLHSDGKKLLKQAPAYASVMGFSVPTLTDIDTRFVNDGDLLDIAAGTDAAPLTIECRHCPGHCPGSLCFVLHDEKTVLTGDALFHLSIGRADLPGGDYDLLINQIKSKLLTLPDDYLVLPGHSITSNIGKERLHNPFLK